MTQNLQAYLAINSSPDLRQLCTPNYLWATTTKVCIWRAIPRVFNNGNMKTRYQHLPPIFHIRIKLNAPLVVKFKCTMPEFGGCGSSNASGSHAKSNGVAQLRKNFFWGKKCIMQLVFVDIPEMLDGLPNSWRSRTWGFTII